ncbi:hypothetical protein WJX81_005549 [Elliptochloris bilobata]|uniref:Expansin-like EG45 domain-containing protein n=1 Tax=Elliptochloris bilobata TaxID=381761 RepID=A0AAW1RP99_9CHLO
MGAILRADAGHICRPLLSGACCLAMLCCAPTAWAATPLSAWTDGIATNYGGPADGKDPYSPSWGTVTGACGYGLLDKGNWPYWSVAALSTSNSFSKAGPVQGCGQCFQIKCVDRAPFQGRCNGDQVSVIVQITDACPECEADHIDIQALTYNKISPMASGRISIQYRRVECVPPQKIIVSVDNNNGAGGWLRLFVESAGGAASVRGVQVRSSGSQGGYVDLINKWGSAWEIPNAPSYPLDVNIIGADGDATTAYQALSGPGQLGKIPTGVQFKISNPGDSALVQGVDGGPSPTGGGQSFVSTTNSPSSTPSPSPSSGGNSGSSGGNSGCSDRPPSQYYTCQQQAQFGSCSQGYMTDTGGDHPQGYCQSTCGRCNGGGSNNGGGNNNNNNNNSNGGNNGGQSTGKGANGQTCPCTDTQPDSSASCQQQAGWGNCGQAFMTNPTNDSPCGHCMRTCGRCSASS